MDDIKRFVAGFRKFRIDFFGKDPTCFESLRHGQNPGTMLIGCSDSRVDPALLTGCGPGELFVVRNVANLVPPYKESEELHGVSAALEYGVCALEVDHIIVLGHSKCGGIGALMSGDYHRQKKGSFIDRWISIADPVKTDVLKELGHKEKGVQQRAAEKASILLSIDNLTGFPFIAERVEAGALFLHGWYFDLEAGRLSAYDAATGDFRIMD
jgi:carbonic anhydrase